MVLIVWFHELVLLNKLIKRVENGVVGGRVKRIKSPNQVDQISILKPDGLVVLLLVVLLNTGELGLELESIAHLVEEEGKEELSPVIVEGDESVDFVLSHRLTEAVAVDYNVRDWGKQDACQVQIGEPPVGLHLLIDVDLCVSYIILEVGDVVEEEDPGVEALIHKVIIVVQLGTNFELKCVLVSICS